MPLPPAIQGARHTGLSLTWSRSDGTPYDLTGATVTGTIKDSTGVRAITGTLTITTAASGIFTWAYSAADLANAGVATVQFRATYGDATYDLSFIEPWIIEATQ